MYETILVPTDGSTGARGAARHGTALAAAFDSEVHLLSVVDERAYSSGLADVDSAIADRKAAFEAEASKAVEDLEPLVAESVGACHTAIEHGVPHQEILAYADQHDVDVIAMGTHGRTGIDRLLLGSVAERVVRTSEAPVLTTRDEPGETDYDRVLIPTDGSETATAAIEHGIAIAARFDATIHALSVLDLGTLAGTVEMGPAIPPEFETLEEEHEQAVAAVTERAAEHDLDAITEVVEGIPFRTIRDYIDERDIDLVAMGTHGRTGLGRYLVGSVTERVVRTSDAPVLTVR